MAAVGTALAIGFVSRRSRLRLDTAIGVLFAGAFAFGVLLYSTIDGYTGDLLGYLLGNILGIGLGDLIQVTILGAAVLAIVIVIRKELLYATFDPLGAAASGLPVGGLEYLLLGLLGVTIIVSIQAVGIILVVAMLVTPAGDGPAARRPVRPDDGRRGRPRDAGRGDRALRELLPERGLGSRDRAGRDRVLPRGAGARTADRAGRPPGRPARLRRPPRRPEPGRRCPLLLVALHDVRGPGLRLARIQAGGPPRLALVEEVVAAIELDLDRLEPVVVLGGQPLPVAGMLARGAPPRRTGR